MSDKAFEVVNGLIVKAGSPGAGGGYANKNTIDAQYGQALTLRTSNNLIVRDYDENQLALLNQSGSLTLEGTLRINSLTSPNIRNDTNDVILSWLPGSAPTVTIAGDLRINGNDIQCSSGDSTITMTSANTATTIRGDTIYLQDSSSAAICGSFVNYSRQYGDFANLNTIVPVAANTAYAFALPTTNNANGISIANTSQITCSNPGNYNLQFSVQWENTDNGADHNLYIWLRRNGANVANTGGRITCVKNTEGIAAWNYIVEATTAGDYFELMYSVDDTAIQLPYIAASSPVPAIPSVILTMVPVGI